MRSIPLNFITMYADLAQGFEFDDAIAGSITTRKIKGKSYLYVTSKDGATRQQRSLGRADDPRVQREAQLILTSAERARSMRTVVSTLKQQARIPAPTLPVGRVLEAIANAGLFKRGVTLVGTAAYQTYPCVLGHYLQSSAFTTNDVDLNFVEFAPRDNEEDIEVVLRRADPTFEPKWHPDDKLPKAFQSSGGLRVDMLTRLMRKEKSVQIEGLGCAAIPLSFQEFPAEDTIDAVALYGKGVLVRVPSPAKFAVHKLIVAQRRNEAGKRVKDLHQAQEIIDILLEIDEAALLDALDDARSRGKAWKTAINASLKQIKRDARQGVLPLPTVYPSSAAAARSAANRSTTSGVVSQAHIRRQPVSPRKV
jgi:hypothetical protein